MDLLTQALVIVVSAISYWGFWEFRDRRHYEKRCDELEKKLLEAGDVFRDRIARAISILTDNDGKKP